MIAPPNEQDFSYAVGLKCACCGIYVSEQDGFCKECQTPVDLSRSVARRNGAQNFISVLGASNAGKTVYLGLLLDLLSKGSQSLRGLATGAFSVALQEQVVMALERRVFPEKTPAEADTWKWLHCQISVNGGEESKHVDLVAPDFAGEAIAMEIEQSGLFPAIHHVVTKSKGILVLCDSAKVRDAGPSEDMFAMKVASYIAQSQNCSVEGGQPADDQSPALAIVFTKCDGCTEAKDDPRAFAANNTPRLIEFCRQTFPRHAFFAASVVGSSGTLIDDSGRQLNVPFHVEPQGISEPLEWIVKNS